MWALDRITWILAAGNGLVGVALIIGSPGTSPALLFLRLWGIPLVVWGAAYLAVTALFVIDQRLVAHGVALFLWLMLAAGALYGLLTGATSSPAATMILAVLIGAVAATHVVGFLFRRKVNHQ